MKLSMFSIRMDTQHINQKIVKQYVMLKVTLVTLSISQRSWIEHLPCVGWDKHVYGERLSMYRTNISTPVNQNKTEL
jgi:hypothetical protein